MLFGKGTCTFSNTSQAQWVRFLGLFMLCGWIWMYQGIFSVIHLGHDEAGQIWISKGLNHHSLLEEAEGGLREVYLNNNTHNLDPGLFSYLLHFWMKLGGDGYLWLKLLPLGFFTAFLYFFYRLMLEALNDPIAPLLAIGLFPLSNVLLTISINIRAYSLEYAASYGLFLYLFNRYTKEQLLKRSEIVMLGMFCALCLWSRYTFSVTIIVTGLYLMLMEQRDLKQRLYNIVIFSTPIIGSLTLLYVAVFTKQLNELQAPELYHHVLIRYQGIASFLHQNLLSIRGLPSVILVFLLILGVVHKNGFAFMGITKRNASYLLFLILSVHSILLAYSIGGLSPWSIQNPRSAHLIVFSLMGLAAMISILLKKISSSACSYLFLGVFMTIAGFMYWNKRAYRHSWLYQLIADTHLEAVPSLGYTTLIPEHKYYLSQSSEKVSLPYYSQEEKRCFLEDSRAPIQKTKTLLLQPRIIANGMDLFETYEVRVVEVESKFY